MQATSRIAEPVKAQIANGKYDKNFLEGVENFMTGFSELKTAFEELPIKGGDVKVKIPDEERAQTEELLADLVENVKKLNAMQETVMDGIKEFMERNSKSMKVFREARGIFDKFVKKPKQAPHFFDRKG